MIKIGMLLGDRYEILEKIGTGGMSDVYKAKDHKLNRFIAVKVLKQEFSENSNFVGKFRTEAQAAAGLMHPNIVNVYDVGSENGIYYIVMELVEGITLKKYIEKKIRLSTKEAVSIAIQVSNGIQAAHNNHIIHRDIKPQNIIISKEGKVKVTDFGIAKAASNNTVSSNVMGSVHYTSPEQARGGFSDERSDIYSMGITLFEMLTGSVPFNGDTTVAIAIKHIQEPMPYVSDFVADVPYSVEQIVLKCCQKSPDRRYQSMNELIADLKKSLVDPDGDFVRVSDPDMVCATRTVDDTEIKKIKKASVREDLDDGIGLANREKQPAPKPNSKKKQAAAPSKQNIKASQKSKKSVEKEVDEEDDYPTTGEKVTTALVIIAAVLIGVVVIFFLGRAVGIWGNTETEETTETEAEEETDEILMPDVVGTNVDDAKAALIDLGLTPQLEYEVTTQYETNTVISACDDMGSEIAAGTVLNANDTVKLIVAQETEGVTVPDVTGLSQAEATSQLNQKGFEVSVLTADNGEVQKGYVISQSPEGNTSAPAGNTIMLTISAGGTTAEEKVSVPNLIGLSEMDAMATLAEHGFATGTVSETNNDDASLTGLVCYQSVEAGSYAESGSSVDFYVSIGPKAATYSFSGQITAPTEDEEYQSGMNVKVTVTADDGTELFTKETAEFPVESSNITGIKSATGKITYVFTVEHEETTYTDPETGEVNTQPAESYEKTVERALTFTAE